MTSIPPATHKLIEHAYDSGHGSGGQEVVERRVGPTCAPRCVARPSNPMDGRRPRRGQRNRQDTALGVRQPSRSPGHGRPPPARTLARLMARARQARLTRPPTPLRPVTPSQAGTTSTWSSRASQVSACWARRPQRSIATASSLVTALGRRASLVVDSADGHRRYGRRRRGRRVHGPGRRCLGRWRAGRPGRLARRADCGPTHARTTCALRVAVTHQILVECTVSPLSRMVYRWRVLRATGRPAKRHGAP